MALDTQNTSSIEVEIDLQQILSLVGIDIPTIPPTGSLPEPPKKIKLKSITGTVVDSITTQPLPGVVVTNKLLKRDTTNIKGEFSIKHPDLIDTGFDPAKFPLNFKLRNYGPYTTIPYKSDGILKSDLGIITLNPLQSNLQKEIQKHAKYLINTVIFNVYSDETFVKNEVNLVIRLEFQSLNETLTNEVVEKEIEKICDGLQKIYEIKFRN